MTLRLTEILLLFGNIRYIYTPLCKPGQERRRPCASAIHLQPGCGVGETDRLTACECSLVDLISSCFSLAYFTYWYNYEIWYLFHSLTKRKSWVSPQNFKIAAVFSRWPPVKVLAKGVFAFGNHLITFFCLTYLNLNPFWPHFYH